MMSLCHGYLLFCFLLYELVISIPHTPLHNHGTSQFAVRSLPHVNYRLPHSWAGQIGIPGTKDDGLFFWLFEAEDKAKSDNLIIWLNGGPGCSSLAGLTVENGPLAFYGDSTVPSPNPYSWTKLANVLYIDQPVGTGFSSGNAEALNNAQVASDFYQWLKAFYAIFSHLKFKRTHIMGESWAGIIIPYFTKEILENYSQLPINLVSISLGDPTFGNFATMTDVSITPYIVQHNHILNVPEDILSVFKEANTQCGFQEVMSHLSYPSQGPVNVPGDPEGGNYDSRKETFGLQNRQASDPNCNAPPLTASQVNESIYGPCFGPCAIATTADNYLAATTKCFNIYDINDHSCVSLINNTQVSNYLNLPAVRAAIHAPNKTAVSCNQTVQATLGLEDVVPPAYSIIPSIIEQGVKVHLYSGDLDFLINHIGTELVIQNMTWCGKQGFESYPGNKFIVDGTVMGNWGYERDLSYHCIINAGHQVPHDQPKAAFAFVRDFVVGYSGYNTHG